MKKHIMVIILSVTIFIVSALGLFKITKENINTINHDPVVFGASYMTLNNQFFEIINNEIKNVVEANGDILITMNPELSLERQIEQINYLIDKKVEVLIINPVDYEGLSDVLKTANNKGIHVITVDTNIDEGKEFIDYTVVSDNYLAGRLCALDMMEQKESANVLLLTHSRAQSANERIAGFKDAIEGHSNFHIVNEIECEGQLEKSMPKVDDYINSGNTFDVVMALNDPSALGAIAALQKNSILSDVLVYGVDGIPETKVLINDGYMRATVAQYPRLMGKRVVEVAYQIIDGAHVADEKIKVDFICIDNIKDFSLEDWQ